MIVHIVVFKFKEENKEANLRKAKEMLDSLETKIDELVSMEVGINFDKSERAFDLSVYAKFLTEKDLHIYAIHEAHLEVVAFIKSVASESKVVDYTLE